MERPQTLPFGLLGLLAAGAAGCPGTLEDPARFLDDSGDPTGVAPEAAAAKRPGDSASCPDIAQAVFLPTCTDSSCHSAQNQAQGLDLQSPDLAARLVGVASTEGAGLLVDPSSPSSSVLYTKLNAGPAFGARMPLGATPLDSATTACVLAWITAIAADQ